ncbi:MAG: NUDIX domain-containing protein [Candidatus Daviesbacteria bacterium]|nr:NUDIX domain-containing protein [Candidatus Daviesbacteria bacterium]
MDEPIIIVCDDKGKPTGKYIPKETGHRGNGYHHLAITVLLISSKGKVLIQKRKHRRFDALLDLTGATDLYHLESGNEDFKEATLRCLKKEYQISKVKNLKNWGGFNYFAKWNKHCENEYCAMMTGEYDGEVKMREDVGYGYKWQDKRKLLKDIEKNPQNYTPWAIEGVKVLKKGGFFSE